MAPIVQTDLVDAMTWVVALAQRMDQPPVIAGDLGWYAGRTVMHLAATALDELDR